MHEIQLIQLRAWAKPLVCKYFVFRSIGAPRVSKSKILVIRTSLVHIYISMTPFDGHKMATIYVGAAASKKFTYTVSSITYIIYKSARICIRGLSMWHLKMSRGQCTWTTGTFATQLITLYSSGKNGTWDDLQQSPLGKYQHTSSTDWSYEHDPIRRDTSELLPQTKASISCIHHIQGSL